ncbi:pancreatic lipase-related protein 2-like isoform X2 [Cylas formicarius]|uniref:pancreatic lipase-related protein 2-like isoform X2 n=1 Tax=Cylas formicarius TaxID=197179 RepID=UPI0029586E65|nr:pancreatic lipase-related protein 2-like isoform X2 [Cylas formicarius]
MSAMNLEPLLLLLSAVTGASVKGDLELVAGLLEIVSSGPLVPALKDLGLVPVLDSDVSYIFYGSELDPGVPLVHKEASQVLTKTTFDVNSETFFIIHGWLGECHTGFLPTSVKPALFTGGKRVNIFVVCWTKWSRNEYITATLALPKVGRLVGDFIAELSGSTGQSLEKFTVVGHSLGAHISGYAGARNQGSIARIVGLDPAGPLYSENDPANRLDPTDARYVHAIHTDATFFGDNYNVGNSDFWVNGGYDQKGCSDGVGICDHFRAVSYYAESLVDDSFVGRWCGSYEEFLAGSCSDNPVGVMGGFFLNTSLSGTYFLDTAASFPYGLGSTGLH